MNPRKPIFDAVKALVPGVWGDPGHIYAMDNLLDAFGVPRESAGRKIGPKGIALIKSFEGCKLAAYPDPGTGSDPWTIGWGATRMDGRAVRKGDVITQARADALLEQDLAKYADEVDKAIGDTPTTQAQFDALVSFHYNTGAIGRATLTKLHKAGDFAAAKAEFGKWVKAGGRTMPGLVRRRAAEAALYSS